MVRYPDYLLNFQKDTNMTTIRRLLNGLFNNSVHVLAIVLLTLAAIFFLRELGNRLPRVKSFILNLARRGLQKMQDFLPAKFKIDPIVGVRRGYIQRTWSRLVRASHRVRGEL